MHADDDRVCVCTRFVSCVFRSVDGILKVDGGRNEFRPLVDQVDHVDQVVRRIRDGFIEDLC